VVWFSISSDLQRILRCLENSKLITKAFLLPSACSQRQRGAAETGSLHHLCDAARLKVCLVGPFDQELQWNFAIKCSCLFCQARRQQALTTQQAVSHLSQLKSNFRIETEKHSFMIAENLSRQSKEFRSVWMYFEEHIIVSVADIQINFILNYYKYKYICVFVTEKQEILHHAGIYTSQKITIQWYNRLKTKKLRFCIKIIVLAQPQRGFPACVTLLRSFYWAQLWCSRSAPAKPPCLCNRVHAFAYLLGAALVLLLSASEASLPVQPCPRFRGVWWLPIALFRLAQHSAQRPQSQADMSGNRFKFTDLGTALPPAFACVCLNLGPRDMVHCTSSKNGRGHRSCSMCSLQRWQLRDLSPASNFRLAQANFLCPKGDNWSHDPTPW
jgi:hypothetical protein